MNEVGLPPAPRGPLGDELSLPCVNELKPNNQSKDHLHQPRTSSRACDVNYADNSLIGLEDIVTRSSASEVHSRTMCDLSTDTVLKIRVSGSRTATTDELSSSYENWSLQSDSEEDGIHNPSYTPIVSSTNLSPPPPHQPTERVKINPFTGERIVDTPRVQVTRKEQEFEDVCSDEIVGLSLDSCASIDGSYATLEGKPAFQSPPKEHLHHAETTYPSRGRSEAAHAMGGQWPLMPNYTIRTRVMFPLASYQDAESVDHLDLDPYFEKRRLMESTVAQVVIHEDSEETTEDPVAPLVPKKLLVRVLQNKMPCRRNPRPESVDKLKRVRRRSARCLVEEESLLSASQGCVSVSEMSSFNVTSDRDRTFLVERTDIQDVAGNHDQPDDESSPTSERHGDVGKSPRVVVTPGKKYHTVDVDDISRTLEETELPDVLPDLQEDNPSTQTPRNMEGCAPSEQSARDLRKLKKRKQSAKSVSPASRERDARNARIRAIIDRVKSEQAPQVKAVDCQRLAISVKERARKLLSPSRSPSKTPRSPAKTPRPQETPGSSEAKQAGLSRTGSSLSTGAVFSPRVASRNGSSLSLSTPSVVRRPGSISDRSYSKSSSTSLRSPMSRQSELTEEKLLSSLQILKSIFSSKAKQQNFLKKFRKMATEKQASLRESSLTLQQLLALISEQSAEFQTLTFTTRRAVLAKWIGNSQKVNETDFQNAIKRLSKI